MSTIFLEFERESLDGSRRLAAFGSDVVFYRDGRWSQRTFEQKVRERVDYLRSLRGSKFTSVTLVGYTPAGSGGRMIRLPRY